MKRSARIVQAALIGHSPILVTWNISSGVCNKTEELKQRQRTLKDALSQKGGVMREVCSEVKDTKSHQRLLRRIMEQDGEQRKALQVNNRGGDTEEAKRRMQVKHRDRMKQLQSQLLMKAIKSFHPPFSLPTIQIPEDARSTEGKCCSFGS